MLKVVFVLGCLLSLTLAKPRDMEHRRLARSDSNSGSDSDSNERASAGPNLSTQQWIQILLALFPTPAPTTAATTTAATTTTTTPTTTTTTAAPVTK
ncbi:cell wall protein DAN4 [Scophthalmus maximus]|uniref:cell wall protein DAN4 n=1 Tax=Scophthalmus maximus TaxID=52904 RepID=UPI0015E06BC7|nr:cell wall protein DAN4 [Scophthalmus maximus]XP_035493239.1 cell wall protein DAN4 [Scophthalmus maximus]